MAADQVGEGHIHHMVQHHFGNPGQVITHLHQGQGALELRRGYSQHMGLLEVTQRLHLFFQVFVGNAQHLLAQVVLQLFLGRRAVQAFGVKQFVQQQRRFRQQAGNPGAVATQAHQLRKRAGVFHQQHHVGGAAQNGLDQLQYPVEGFRRILNIHQRVQQ